MKRLILFGAAVMCVVICGTGTYGQKLEEKSKVKLAKGLVYHDANGNGKFDEGEKPLAAVRVSNGRRRGDDR